MAQQDPLTLDISKDLEPIDEAVTRLISDETLSEEFRRDPNGSLVRVGLHPPAAPDVNDRVNRAFYAAVTNVELNQIVAERFRSFKPSKPTEYREYHMEGLAKGRIQNLLEFDLEAANHIFNDAQVLTKVFRVFLTDLNNKNILLKSYPQQTIEEFVGALVTAIRERKAITEHPTLEQWDRNYGVGGFHFGAEAVEVGPVATAYTAVEIGLFVTVAVEEAAIPTADELKGAQAGNRAALSRLALMSRILQFRSDLMLHAFQFEGRR
jgi:hypothetical protein